MSLDYFNNYKNWKLKRHIQKFGSKNNGYFNYFNKDWFEEHQNTLIWLLNHWLLKYWLRWILRIHKDCKFSEYIDEIKPHTYRISLGNDIYRSDFRTHQKFSKRIYYAFRPVWYFAHFFDWVLLDRFEPVPNFGFSTLTAYPDASSGSTTCDGVVARKNVDETFATIRAGAGTHVDNTTATDYPCGFIDSSTTNQFVHLLRSIFTFDTSTVVPTISSTVFSIYVNNYVFTIGNDTNVIVDVSPTANNSFVAGDFNTFTTTTLSDGNIPDNTPTNNAYNSLTFNATGNSKVGAITKVGMRSGWDNANSFGGSWVSVDSRSTLTIYYADQTGTSNDPKLVVTYTITSSIKSINGLDIENVKTINGIAGASIKSIMGLTYVQPVPEPPWYGSRGVFGGNEDYINSLYYVSISTESNTSFFGNLSAIRRFFASCSSGSRGIFAGGGNSPSNIIDYITIATTGNAVDFGDTTVLIMYVSACSSSVRGIVGGGYGGSGAINVICYITIASVGNATDFGDLTVARQELTACSNGIRGIFSGGNSASNIIDYVTIATTGNAVDFGDLTIGRANLAGCSNSTRGCFGGGDGQVNVIDYITIATTGNATDFGDLTVARNYLASCSNGSRGIFGGGNPNTNVIDYITIASVGNATDFGDLTVAKYGLAACSGN